MDTKFQTFIEAFRNDKLQELVESINGKFQVKKDELVDNGKEEGLSQGQATGKMISIVSSLGGEYAENVAINLLTAYHQWLLENYELIPRK